MQTITQPETYRVEAWSYFLSNSIISTVCIFLIGCGGAMIGEWTLQGALIASSVFSIIIAFCFMLAALFLSTQQYIVTDEGITSRNIFSTCVLRWNDIRRLEKRSAYWKSEMGDFAAFRLFTSVGRGGLGRQLAVWDAVERAKELQEIIIQNARLIQVDEQASKGMILYERPHE